MSREPETGARAVTSDAKRTRALSRVLRRRESDIPGLLGGPELVALGSSALLLVIALLAYFYFLVPARSRLAGLQLQRDSLQRQLQTSREGMKTENDAQTSIAAIVQSVREFEDQRLPSRDEQRMALYNELNTLIHKNNLRNTAGPTYTQLNGAGETATGTTASGSSQTPANQRWQTVYPGIGINLTVEGAYPNLRHFLRDIEASRQFIVINGVEIEGARDVESSAAQSPRSAPGAAEPAPVSLRLNMTAFFRRSANDESPAPGVQPPRER